MASGTSLSGKAAPRPDIGSRVGVIPGRPAGPSVSRFLLQLARRRGITLERDGSLHRPHEDPSMAFKLIQQLRYRIRALEGMLLREADAPAWREIRRAMRGPSNARVRCVV